MATFALIHGGGGSGWDWHLVGAELRRRGHDVVAPDLPIEDPAAKLADFADAVVAAVSDRQGERQGDRPGDRQGEVVVVAHSYGGFTAPLVADRLDARLLVFVAGMVPAPGETPGQWWGNVGYTSAEGLSVVEQFLGDVPPELAAENIARGRDQRSDEWNDPWPLAALPGVPTRVLLCRDDRLFAPELQRRVAKERLGITPDEIDGSHMVLLSRPVELAERLDGYLAALR